MDVKTKALKTQLDFFLMEAWTSQEKSTLELRSPSMVTPKKWF